MILYLRDTKNVQKPDANSETRPCYKFEKNRIKNKNIKTKE